MTLVHIVFLDCLVFDEFNLCFFISLLVVIEPIKRVSVITSSDDRDIHWSDIQVDAA